MNVQELKGSNVQGLTVEGGDEVKVKGEGEQRRFKFDRGMSEETLGSATAHTDHYRDPMSTDLTELTDAYPTETREKNREAHLSQQVKGEGGVEVKVKGEGEQRSGSLFAAKLDELLDRLGAIEEHLDNLDTLNELRERHRQVVANSRRTKKSVTSQENVTSQKEEEKGKETFPPAPPIEKGEKEKKAAAAAAACAREDDSFPPTLDDVTAFAADIGASPEFASEWHGQMEKVNHWKHAKTGEPIKSWRRVFQLWWMNRDSYTPCVTAEKPADTELDPTTKKLMKEMFG